MVKAMHKNGLNLLTRGLMVAGLSSFALFALAQKEKVLNVDSWSDYIALDTIQNFVKETGIKVRYDTYDNNEIVHAKLVAGETGYDTVVPSSTFARLQIDGGLLTQLDVAQLPNLKATLRSEPIPDNVWELFFNPKLATRTYSGFKTGI